MAENRAQDWAEEESEINPRNDNREPSGAPDGDLWRSVWKRIEKSRDAQDQDSAQAPEVPLEQPRDYVVETDNVLPR